MRSVDGSWKVESRAAEGRNILENTGELGGHRSPGLPFAKALFIV